jgi:hypothetical protein
MSYRNPRTARACLIGALLILSACASKVQVPPRVVLSEWGTIGIVSFQGGADPELAHMATARFVQMLQSAQPGARILELGSEHRVLSEVGHGQLDFEAVRALGSRFEVDALFWGDLEIGTAQPSVRFGEAFTSANARADVSGQLATKLLETRSGATVWSRSSSASANVARIGVSDAGLPSFGVTDPARAYEGLVHQLVANLGGDFHPRWEKR